MYGQNVDISSTETRKELEVELEAQGLFFKLVENHFKSLTFHANCPKIHLSIQNLEMVNIGRGCVIDLKIRYLVIGEVFEIFL